MKQLSHIYNNASSSGNNASSSGSNASFIGSNASSIGDFASSTGSRLSITRSKTNLITLILGLSILSVSCRKLISIPDNPPTQVPQSHVFSDSADIEAAVAGIYANFKVPTANVSWANGVITTSAGMSADELISTSATDQSGPQFYQNALHIDNTAVASMWNQAYKDLYQMNVCIEGITGTTAISDSLKKILIGQVKVVRALYYLNLVNLFGGVPVVTSSDYAANAILPRATVDSVYSLIQADLADARAKLPTSYPTGERYRPSLYAAQALSARVYLYRKDWTNAALMAGQVINSGAFSLLSDPNGVFLDGSNEAIWQLPGNGTSFQTAEGYTFNPPSWNPTPSFTFNPYLVSAFETGDLRRQDWVSTSVSNGKTYYYPRKYKNAKATGVTTQEDYMILRFAEQYLILAEAQARQNQLNTAVTNLNIIRSRATLPASNASSQSDVVTAILHERQTELFCEWGHRWYDLKRTGIIDSVFNVEKPGLWNDNMALYPVPMVEIQNNHNLAQNLGY